MGRISPHPTLGRRRTLQPAQRLPTLPPTPHPHPPRRLANTARPRNTPRNRPAHHPRPRTTPTPQHPAPTTDLRLATSRVIRMSGRLVFGSDFEVTRAPEPRAVRMS